MGCNLWLAVLDLFDKIIARKESLDYLQDLLRDSAATSACRDASREGRSGAQTSTARLPAAFPNTAREAGVASSCSLPPVHRQKPVTVLGQDRDMSCLHSNAPVRLLPEHKDTNVRKQPSLTSLCSIEDVALAAGSLLEELCWRGTCRSARQIIRQQDRHEAMLRVHPGLMSEVCRNSSKCCQAYTAALKRAVTEEQESAFEGVLHMVRVGCLPHDLSLMGLDYSHGL